MLSRAQPEIARTTRSTGTNLLFADEKILTATPIGTDDWLVTALSGTQDGLPISLVAPGVYGANDNEIYQPPDFPYVVDRAGLDFTDSTNIYNVFDNNVSVVPPVYHECSSAVESNCSAQADDAATITLSITPPSTVPEPASVGPVGLVLVLAVAVLLRRKSAVS